MFRNEFYAAMEKEQNPSAISNTCEIDDLMEKFKFLQIDASLLRELQIKPFSKYYFMKPTNSGEQFYIFISICAWLVRKTGQNFKQPQEFDDPSLLIANLIKIMQDMVSFLFFKKFQ